MNLIEIKERVSGSIEVLDYLNGILSSSLDYNVSQSQYGGSIEFLYQVIDAQFYHLKGYIEDTEIQPYFTSEQSQSIASALYSASIY
tara:strand:- start:1521 stop:1781 length:261 start_codon:yes stop_codon:yes gene_type:complete